MNVYRSIVSCVAVACVLSIGSVVRADYADEILSDEPVAYWRLGDEDMTLPAVNLGSALSAVDGTYVGGFLLEEDGLIFGDADTAALFNGLDTEVRIPDSNLINNGGPHELRSIELWFRADTVPPEGGMLFEEGGATRGLNMYVMEVGGEDRIFMTGWNRDDAQGRWESVVVSTDIEEGAIYHAVMVLDGSANDVFGDFDGRITGYLDGEKFETALGADDLHGHGDNIAIGGIDVNSWVDGANPGDGMNFAGIIDEVAVYNMALDDPDNNGDFGDSRVLAHFRAGIDTGACPKGLLLERMGSEVKLSWDRGGAETSVRVVRNGSELAAAAPVAAAEFIDTTAAPGSLLYELTFDAPACEPLTRAIDTCIADLKTANLLDSVELSWENQFEYTNIIVRRGDDVLATIGGDEVTYTDVEPPPGLWTYSAVPENGDCEPTEVVLNGCITGFTADASRDGVELAWTNNFNYSEIIVRRGDEIIDTISGDSAFYTDFDAPPGVWTYTVVPAEGDCEPTAAVASVFGSEYAHLVREDGAVAYWRLGEEDEGEVVRNDGSLGDAVDGSHSGEVAPGMDSIVPGVSDNLALGFNGIDAEVHIPDSNQINTGGPWNARSIELWFQPDFIEFQRGVLYEEGGGTRGINIYVEDVLGQDMLFMAAWNRDDAQGRWEPVSVSVEIEEGETYYAVMVFDSSANDTFGDFDGRITGYLNGEEFETAFGADQLYGHSDNISIGGIDNNTRFADNSSSGDGSNFTGIIDEVAVYNMALDDPNEDEDFEDSRVMEHYLAGSQGDGPEVASLKPGDINGDGSFNIADMVAQLGFLFGGGDLPECFIVRGSDPKELNATGLTMLDYNGDGSSNIADAVAGLGGLFGGTGPHVLGGDCAEIEGTCQSNCQ